MKIRVLLLAAAAALTTASATAQAKGKVCPGRHLATVEPDGSVSAGSLKAVLDAARNGAELRVGWELGPREAPFLVHWQDARFITVFEGQVFAQVGDIHHQFGLSRRAHVGLGKDWSLWAASIGTNGKMVGRLSTETEPKEQPVVSHWCRAA